MLGSELVGVLAERKHDVLPVTRAELDLTDRGAVDAGIAGVDAVVYAAAYTDVDGAESDEASANAVNADAAGRLARAARAAGARFVYVSTDYVFDGTARSPIPENARPAPVSAYGRSKAEGERLVRAADPDAYIVRTAWLYGRNGNCFPRTIARLARERDTLDVVNDQIGQPTWTRDLAEQIALLLETRAPGGVYHATNGGEASWFDFARAVVDADGMDPQRVRPTDSRTFSRPAPRPAYSVLAHDSWAVAGLPEMRPWREAFIDAVAQGVLR